MTVANAEETVVAIPVVVPPVEVEVALRTVPAEVRHVAVAVDLRDGALCEMPSMAPSIEYSLDCIVCATLCVASISHQLSLFFQSRAALSE